MRDRDRPAPGTIDAERAADGFYAPAPEPTLWADLSLFGCLSVAISALATAWPFVILGLWLIGD